MNRVSRAALLASVIVVGMWGLNAAPAFAVPPVTTPTITAPTAAATVGGDVALTATSTATSVQFYADAIAIGTPVAVDTGAATTTWPTYGFANGASFGLTAADCNVDGCNATQSAVVNVTLLNTDPVVTAPSEGASTNSTPTFTATSPGGGLNFSVDGTFVNFDAAAPFSFTVATPLADGAHTVSVQECDVTGVTCDGPTATNNFTVVTPSLHPTIASVAPNPFSPVVDGRDDIAAFRVHLPDTETVSFSIFNSNNQSVNGPHAMGTLAAGDHTFHWNGTGNSGHIAGNGVFTIVVTTSAVVDAVTEHGTATATVTVDNTGPTVKGAGGNGVTFYPVVDGYLDTFGPKATVSEGGKLWLQIYTSTGTLVNQVAQAHASPGTFQIKWNGRNKSNGLAGEGTFKYHFLAEDLAGNRSVTANGVVHLSHKHLVNKSISISHDGKDGHLTTTETSCTGYSYKLSTFPNGVWLENSCSTNTFQAVFAEYNFAVPGATQYNTITVQSYGNTISAPEVIGALVYNAKLKKYAQVGVSKIGRDNVDLTSTYGKVPAASVVNANHHVLVDLFVPNAVSPEDYDIGHVTITLSYSVLA